MDGESWVSRNKKKPKLGKFAPFEATDAGEKVQGPKRLADEIVVREHGWDG